MELMLLMFSVDLMGRMRSLREKEKTAKVRTQQNLQLVYIQLKLKTASTNKLSFLLCLTGKNERTVVMDKSKGEPVISVKTKSKERVSKHGPENNFIHLLQTRAAFITSIYRPPPFYLNLWDISLTSFFIWFLPLFSPFLQSSKSRDRKSPSKEKKDILSFDQIKEQRERERQRQREREIREVERRRYT